jgi:hypothetical protein
METKLERPSKAVGACGDKRRSDRTQANLLMTLLIEHQGTKVRQKVWTVDITLLGVRIRSCEVLVPGQMVILIPSDRSFNVYPCRVAWVGPLGPELYSDAGLEFKSVGRWPS